MKQGFCAFVFGIMLFAACNKKEPETLGEKATESAAKAAAPGCLKEIITDKPVKVGETGIILPAGTSLCFSADMLEIKASLPAGYAFLGNDPDKPLPIWGTYSCSCSQSGGNCQVFYAEGLGFGCLQSTCSGACTGKFTYKGYTVEKVISTTSKEEFLQLPEVQAEIAKISSSEVYSKHSVYGVSFFLVNDEAKFIAAAKCNCEGTAACKLKVITLLFKKIYFCEGTCNGCELTV